MRLLVDSINRSIWGNNVFLAEKLIKHSDVAKDLLFISQEPTGRKVNCRDYEAFDFLFCQVRSEQQRATASELEMLISGTANFSKRKQLKGRLKAVRSSLPVFFKTKRLLKLNGITIEDGADGQINVTCPSTLQSSLSSFWGEVYSLREGDHEQAAKLLHIFESKHYNDFDFNSLQLPGQELYLRIINKVSDSATGINGLPYSAYKAQAVTSSIVWLITQRFWLLLNNQSFLKILTNKTLENSKL